LARSRFVDRWAIRTCDRTAAPNGKEAFKEDARRLQEHGGSASPDTHNKIESPGKKLLKKER